LQWFEVLEGLLGPYWKAIGLAFNCTFLLFGSVIQLIACARYEFPLVKVDRKLKSFELVAKITIKLIFKTLVMVLI